MRVDGAGRLRQVLGLLTDAAEFDELPVRHNEDNLNADLSKLVRWPLPPGMYDDPHGKAAHGTDAPFTRIPNGVPGLETCLPVIFSEGVARGRITISRDALRLIRAGQIAKGDPLQAARLAGIMAAKRTSELIPLCHPLPLSHVASLVVREGPLKVERENSSRMAVVRSNVRGRDLVGGTSDRLGALRDPAADVLDDAGLGAVLDEHAVGDATGELEPERTFGRELAEILRSEEESGFFRYSRYRRYGWE